MIGTSASSFPREDRIHLSIDPIEQIAARRHAVFDDLVQSRAKLAAWQRFEERGVDGDERRLMERADQVLSRAGD